MANISIHGQYIYLRLTEYTSSTYGYAIAIVDHGTMKHTYGVRVVKPNPIETFR